MSKRKPTSKPDKPFKGPGGKPTAIVAGVDVTESTTKPPRPPNPDKFVRIGQFKMLVVEKPNGQAQALSQT